MAEIFMTGKLLSGITGNMLNAWARQERYDEEYDDLEDLGRHGETDLPTRKEFYLQKAQQHAKANDPKLTVVMHDALNMDTYVNNWHNGRDTEPNMDDPSFYNQFGITEYYGEGLQANNGQMTKVIPIDALVENRDVILQMDMEPVFEFGTRSIKVHFDVLNKNGGLIERLDTWDAETRITNEMSYKISYEKFKEYAKDGKVKLKIWSPDDSSNAELVINSFTLLQDAGRDLDAVDAHSLANSLSFLSNVPTLNETGNYAALNNDLKLAHAQIKNFVDSIHSARFFGDIGETLAESQSTFKYISGVFDDAVANMTDVVSSVAGNLNHIADQRFFDAGKSNLFAESLDLIGAVTRTLAAMSSAGSSLSSLSFAGFGSASGHTVSSLAIPLLWDEHRGEIGQPELSQMDGNLFLALNHVFSQISKVHNDEPGLNLPSGLWNSINDNMQELEGVWETFMEQQSILMLLDAFEDNYVHNGRVDPDDVEVIEKFNAQSSKLFIQKFEKLGADVTVKRSYYDNHDQEPSSIERDLEINHADSGLNVRLKISDLNHKGDDFNGGGLSGNMEVDHVRVTDVF